MSHQDWETVVLTKPIKVETKSTPPPVVNDGDIVVHAKIDIELKNAIQKARMIQKMSQKDLALKMAIPVSTIIGYENGKEIPNNAFIAKLEKILNTKLPRISKNKRVE